MKAWSKYNILNNEKNARAAETLFSSALSIDPEYEPALAGRSRARYTIGAITIGNKSSESEQVLAAGAQDALRAIELDSGDPVPHFALAGIRRYQHRVDLALTENERALDLNSSYVEAMSLQAQLLKISGQFEPALEWTDRAISLSPFGSTTQNILMAKCACLALLGRYEEALPWCERNLSEDIWWGSAAYILAVYQALGDRAKAAEAKKMLFALEPDVSIRSLRDREGSDNKAWLSAYDRTVLAQLRSAGIPD